MTGRGHNGGPPLDEPVGREGQGQCRWCRHWRPPAEAAMRDYEHFRLGLSQRRVRKPHGACDRMLIAPGKPLAFSATAPESTCFNFSAKPPAEPPRGDGYVTIYDGERLVWSGAERDLPDIYR